VPDEQALYFVDIAGQALCRYVAHTGEYRRWPTPLPISAASRAISGEFVVVLSDGFYSLDLDSAGIEPRALVSLPNGVKFNDGKVDRQGRFVAGTLERAMQNPVGALYRLEGNRAIQIDQDYILVNGPCWNPTGDVFYCADSITRVIHAYDYNGLTGAATNRRFFASTTALGGIPDGATVDTLGRMWMAVCRAGKVVAFAPDGSLEVSIDMPTPWVSSVMFGGPLLDRLFVTSLTLGTPIDENSGFLYVIDGLGATGIAELPVSA
jgi:sugar lactone lactonase YvrE